MVMAILACTSPGQSTLTPIPTQTLVSSTPTNTPIVPTVTPTSPPPLLPGDLITEIPEVLVTLQAPEEFSIAEQALADLETRVGQNADFIQLAHFEAVTWSNADLDCERVSNPPTEEISGYWLLFVVGNLVYAYHTDEGDDVRLCDETEVRSLRGEMLTLVDPVAAEMVALARRRLATELDLPSRRVQLLEADAITWQNTGFGCPAEDQTYEPLIADGYRLVMGVGEEEYIFHTNFERLILCDAENEVLP